MKCYFIRHGKTAGNLKLHFNGSGTDEPLVESGKEELKAIDDAAAGAVLFTSPMKRARETASIMLPDLEQRVIDDLREMDFGMFEGKSHTMLDGDPDYQEWLDSAGEKRIPGGEKLSEFSRRVAAAVKLAYEEAVSQGAETMYIVAHGGTIMAAMSMLTGEKYYEFNLPNGAGFIAELEENDAEYGLAATSYDRFCGGLRAGSDAWRPPQYTPSGSLDR
jgi:alpha-ribazole phosphatase